MVLGWTSLDADLSPDQSHGKEGPELTRSRWRSQGNTENQVNRHGRFEDRGDGRPSAASVLIPHEAELIDISQTGICLLLRQLPPGKGRLWLGSAEHTAGGWAEVILRSVSEPRADRFLLRLSFADHCPYELFKIAVVQPPPDPGER